MLTLYYYSKIQIYFFELYEYCAYSANPNGIRWSDTQHEYT